MAPVATDASSDLRLLQGNEACALGALAAGCRFYAGYPITPSSEIAEYMARRLPGAGGVFIQMEDEIASICACIGASLGGAKAMTATSGPGFSLMQENLGYAALCEVPLVIVDVQRVGPSTGMPTLPAQGDVMQARWGTHGDHPVVVLAPASVADTYRLTVAAFNISERLRLPVVLLSDEVVAHMREMVEIESVEIVDREVPTGDPATYLPFRPAADGVAVLAPPGQGYRFHVTGLYHGEDGFVTNDPEEAGRLIHRLGRKVGRHREWLTLSEEHDLDDAEVAVFAYGSPARAALRAVRDAREDGRRAGLFKAETIWPFPAARVSALARQVRAILVPEMNLGQLVGEVERAAGGACRVVPLAKVGGELFTPAEISDALRSL
jgi:2-oxoglutarate/2-oxoacid ferredoxin oxidoreductase subunit alpha